MKHPDIKLRSVQDRILHEVSLRRPPRGGIWVATYSGPEPGGPQIVRSTRLADYAQALALAKRWEQEARVERHRRFQAQPPPKPGRPPGLTQAEVAALLGLSPRTVRAIEKRALRKLRSHPLLRTLWSQLESSRGENIPPLTRQELDALFELVVTPLERHALAKALAIIWTAGD